MTAQSVQSVSADCNKSAKSAPYKEFSDSFRCPCGLYVELIRNDPFRPEVYKVTAWRHEPHDCPVSEAEYTHADLKECSCGQIVRVDRWGNWTELASGEPHEFHPDPRWQVAPWWNYDLPQPAYGVGLAAESDENARSTPQQGNHSTQGGKAVSRAAPVAIRASGTDDNDDEVLLP